MNRGTVQPRFIVNGVGTGEVTQWEVFDRTTALRVGKPHADADDAATVAMLLNSLTPSYLPRVILKITQEAQK